MARKWGMRGLVLGLAVAAGAAGLLLLGAEAGPTVEDCRSARTRAECIDLGCAVGPADGPERPSWFCSGPPVAPP